MVKPVLTYPMSRYMLEDGQLLPKDSTTQEPKGCVFQMRDLRRRVLCFSFPHKESSRKRDSDSLLQHEVLRQNRIGQSLFRRETHEGVNRENEISPQQAQIRCWSWQSELYPIWNRIRIPRKSSTLVEKISDGDNREVRAMWILRQKGIESAPQGPESRPQRAREPRTAMLELPCD